LTYAAERGLHDVAAILLAGKASVNHRFRGGGTALYRAVQNDDLYLAKMLIEHGADPKLLVESEGRPIRAMHMSEGMRTIIPYWDFGT